jgi:DNA-binding NarL/FixJ family response regulator
VTVSGSEVRPTSVFLCDDVPEMRAIVQDVLADDPAVSVVGEADNGRDCVRLIGRLQPDVVLLDVSMPDMDGLEAIPQIAAVAPRTAIVVFSGFGADRIGDVALRLGADRYIEKGTQIAGLALAVRQVAASRQAAGLAP